MSENEGQIFSQPATEVIKARKSVRTYKNKPLSEDMVKRLEAYFSQLKNPFTSGVRFKLIHSDMAENKAFKLGTYGVIKGSSTYIAGVTEKGDQGLLGLGYAMEKLVLYATSLGLGTCWLAGFNKGEFSKAAGLGKDELLPSISPVGYGEENPRLFEKAMKAFAGSNSRKPWQELFFKDTFGTPLDEKEADRYATPLEMVRLAPSASNKQPWRIVKEGIRYHFYLQEAKGYAGMLGFNIQEIDLGIALCHFDLTAGEMGLDGGWVREAPAVNTPDGTKYIITWAAAS